LPEDFLDADFGRLDDAIAPTGKKAFAGFVMDNEVNTAALVVAIADRRSNEKPSSLLFAADSEEILKE